MRDDTDEVEIARKIGVKIGEDCQIYDNAITVFNTEPYSTTIGNHVLIAHGVRFLPHEGGIWCIRGMNEKYKEMDCFAPIIIENNRYVGYEFYNYDGCENRK